MADTTHTDTAAAHAGPAEHGHGGHGAHDAKEHEKHYWKIYWVLLVLLIVSVVGPFIGDATGVAAITLITAFGIALVKAALVVKNFMHLNMEPKYVAYLCATALALMALLFFWVAPDVMKHEGHQWVNRAAIAATAAGDRGAIEARPFEVAETFVMVCGPCHGPGGAGDGAASAALDPRPANFHAPEFWAERDLDAVEAAIAGGGPAVGKSPLMPAFSQQYTPEQIRELAEHVLAMRPDAPAEEAPVEEAPAEEAAEVAEAQPAEAPPAEGPAVEAPPPAGPSAAEKARQAAWITERLYR